MSTTEKSMTEAHYHVWLGGPSASEVTVMVKAPEPFPTRKSALSWLRERCDGSSKVLVCRDDLCPAREPTRRRPAPGSQPGGSPF